MFAAQARLQFHRDTVLCAPQRQIRTHATGPSNHICCGRCSALPAMVFTDAPFARAQAMQMIPRMVYPTPYTNFATCVPAGLAQHLFAIAHDRYALITEAHGQITTYLITTILRRSKLSGLPTMMASSPEKKEARIARTTGALFHGSAAHTPKSQTLLPRAQLLSTSIAAVTYGGVPVPIHCATCIAST